MSVPSRDAGGTIHMESISDAHGGSGGKPSSFFHNAGTGGDVSGNGLGGSWLGGRWSGHSMSLMDGCS